MNRKTLSIASLVGLFFGGVSPSFAYGLGNFFSPVPKIIQQSMSGIVLGYGTLHQNYTEQPAVAGEPNPLDSQTGNINAYQIKLAGMGDYLGMATKVSYDKGITNYNGYLQSFNSSGSLVFTPSQVPTQSQMVNFAFELRLGFSPIHDIAIIPDVFLGRHGWERNIQGANGYDETYTNKYFGYGVTLAGAVPDPHVPLVFQIKYKTGHTGSASMTSSNSGDTANLGSEPWHQYGVELDYIPWSFLTVFVSYSHTQFQYGQSQPVTLNNGVVAVEPNSTTKQNVAMAGLKLRF
ncbi:hypothetical protein [Acidihalobacter prosperus]|uniref:Uncharacterized protein n=1 Tax=Acidihalobacter prosperus TaxID=160660 RepID=A0A1A6C379_9GAMM|nr:hypothetical protein [Acidihalobacter prosperus]OBS09000.1 hypothetical protein Thpro_022117 [Acidihalobacter prosperus]